MGLPQPKSRGYTLDDWQSWEGRWELINGVVYDMTPAPSLEHQRISSRLHLQIGRALEDSWRDGGGGDCEVFAAPLDVFLGSNVVQPDLVVVCDPEKKTPRGIEGAPDLVVEILSPGTAGKDLTRKRWAYESAKVPEYLWVDPEERLGVLLRLDPENRYQEASRVEWGEVISILDGRVSLTVGD